MDFLISDTHYFHKNILSLELSTRGHFNSMEEMHDHLIKQWNLVVKPEDTVYHLGDVSMHGSYSRMVDIISKLNGNIILIQGNHDELKVCSRLLEDGYIKELHEVGIKLKINKQSLWLSHYPMEIGLRDRKWSIHGHIHSSKSRYLNQINVGVDSAFMNEAMELPFGQPLALDRLIDHLETLTMFS